MQWYMVSLWGCFHFNVLNNVQWFLKMQKHLLNEVIPDPINFDNGSNTIEAAYM